MGKIKEFLKELFFLPAQMITGDIVEEERMKNAILDIKERERRENG
jgi:hypothetical protein